MIGATPIAGDELMVPSGAAEDMSRHDCMRHAIQRAFPLPSTGAFADVLAALDAGPANPPEAASARE